MNFRPCVNETSQDKTADLVVYLPICVVVPSSYFERLPFELSSSFFKGVAKAALDWAHRTSTF